MLEKHELQARIAAVVPAVVFKHKIQGCEQTRAGRNGQSISVQFRPGRGNDNATISTSFSPTTNITLRGLAIQGLRIGKTLSMFNNQLPSKHSFVKHSPMYCSEASSCQHKHHHCRRLRLSSSLAINGVPSAYDRNRATQPSCSFSKPL